jgi:putative spermidine/putrescine transport system permease protein
MPKPMRAVNSVAVLPVTIFYGVFLGLPLLSMVATSLSGGGSAYKRLFADPLFAKAVATTLQISVITTAVTIVLAYICALAAWRSTGAIRATIIGLVLVPLATSIMVKTLAWTIILQSNGVANTALQHLGLAAHPVHLLYTRFAVVLGMVQYVVPYAFLPIYTSLLSIDTRLERAAWSLGASRLQSFLRVIVPMSLPGVAGGTILSFITATGFFVTPALLGSPRDAMIANLVEYYARQLVDFPVASALGVLIFVSLGMLAVYYQRFTQQNQERRAHW